MTSFFADQESTIEIPFDDGTKVIMRRYYDAGIEEDLRNNLMRLEVKGQNGTSTQEARVNLGDLLTLQMMIKRIELPDGSVLPRGGPKVGMETLRRMHPNTRRQLIAVINENNPLDPEPEMGMIVE